MDGLVISQIFQKGHEKTCDYKYLVNCCMFQTKKMQNLPVLCICIHFKSIFYAHLYAVMVADSRETLNGLYLVSGFRNGYVQYTECINHRASIYCNPKRGWTVSYNNAVCFYSYPLTPYPPTLKNRWNCQGFDDDDNMPQIRTSQSIGYHLLDLLFVGFYRYNSRQLHEVNWLIISADIVQIFVDYFVVQTPDECENCSIECKNLMLYGLQWLCLDCSTYL